MTAKKEVEAILRKRGWTQYRLAQESGVLLPTISRILDEGLDPRHSTMEKLRKAAAKAGK